MLKDRIVFVTGASSGIGAACAEAFAREGARLILAARRADRLRQFAEALKEMHGTECLVQTLDVRVQPDVERFVAGLPAEWEAIDILVNNAGLSRGLDKLHEGLLSDWEEMLDTNGC